VKPAHLHQLEAWTQEELHAQREYARSLESYERAVVRGDLAALAAGTAELDAQFARTRTRDARRGALLGAIASDLRVARGTLTLRSLCERAGAAGERLTAARGELEAAARRTRELARRIAILARTQEGVLGEALEAAFGRGESAIDGQGRLVDARG
jgi:hypothetical protein